MMIKYRVHEVAKDFKTNSKTIANILTEYATTPKNHMQVLEESELDLIFEYLTQHHQVETLAELYEPTKGREAQGRKGSGEGKDRARAREEARAGGKEA
jgi:translation initiation factor IF-2